MLQDVKVVVVVVGGGSTTASDVLVEKLLREHAALGGDNARNFAVQINQT